MSEPEALARASGVQAGAGAATTEGAGEGDGAEAPQPRPYDRMLAIRREYLDRILSGEKTLEIRHQRLIWRIRPPHFHWISSVPIWPCHLWYTWNLGVHSFCSIFGDP